MLFQDIPGLIDTKQKLTDVLSSGKIPHALMFVGTEGSVALPMALAFAQSLQCENFDGNDSCNQCSSCRMSSKYQHPDISFIFPAIVQPSGKKTECSLFLDQWRQFLNKNPFGTESEWRKTLDSEKNLVIPVDVSRATISQLSLSSFGSKYKIMLCWMTEKMNVNAANALLKLIEEPPKKTILIFCTEDIDKILVTIQSRTQKISVPQLDRDNFIKLLQNYTKEENIDKLSNAHFISNGALGRAIEFLNNDDFEDDIGHLFWNFLRLCYKREFETLVKWNAEFHTRGKQYHALFFTFATKTFAEITSSFVGIKTSFNNEKHGISVMGICKRLNHDKLISMVQIFNETRYTLERNGSVKLQMMNMAIQVAKTFHQ